MSAPLEDSDFIDRDYLATQTARPATPLAPTAPMNAPIPSPSGRPPNRDELENQLTARHQQLAELKAKQEAIERERVAIEEARRRQAEFETGRPEITAQLVRGIELLAKAEFEARRDAEQMSRTLAGLREAIAAVEGLRPEAWTPENWQTELSRALTTLENARMEWNAARLKWNVLQGGTGAAASAASGPAPRGPSALFEGGNLRDLARVGLALTWPLAVVALLALILLTILVLRG